MTNTYGFDLSYNIALYGVIFLLLAIINEQRRRLRALCRALQLTEKNELPV